MSKSLSNIVREVQEECLNGLYTDGAHHKQESLDTILKLVSSAEEVEEFKSTDGDWMED